MGNELHPAVTVAQRAKRLSASLVAGLALAVVAGLAPGCARSVIVEGGAPDADRPEPALTSLTATALDGTEHDLGRYAGQVVLVVNVASECGFTPQYQGLQALHEEFSDQGFTVIGFPSNEFGGQEPGTATDILEFCSGTYGVTFPMMGKVEVRQGPGQSPVYALLTSAAGEEPGWNFCKYLVGRDGRVRAFFNSFVEPSDDALRDALRNALGESPPPASGR